MSVEIFISYRRSDSQPHARLVHDRLLGWFEARQVFFDQVTIPVATRFDDVIVAALSQCRVVLVLIGPTWAQVEHAGRRRLHDPEDLVRKEVALALATGKHVIPVLLDATTMPGAELLPADLSALCGINAHQQRPDKAYDDDFERLARRIVELGVSPRPRKVPSERETLPYLCDRSQQQELLSDTVGPLVGRPDRPPMVVTLLGCADEAHWAFIERLEMYSLPRLFTKTVLSPGEKFVRITERLSFDESQERFNARLRNAIATGLMLGPVADDAALVSRIKEEKRTTLVVVLSWHLPELGRRPDLALQCVFNYWDKFPALGARLFAACVVCLKYDARKDLRSSWWTRLRFGRGAGDAALDTQVEALRTVVREAARTFAASPSVAWIDAPELEPVNDVDLERWLDAVRDEGGVHLSRETLLGVLEGQPRAMGWLLPKLKELLVST